MGDGANVAGASPVLATTVQELDDIAMRLGKVLGLLQDLHVKALGEYPSAPKLETSPAAAGPAPDTLRRQVFSRTNSLHLMISDLEAVASSLGAGL